MRAHQQNPVHVFYDYAPFHCRWIRWPCRCVVCNVQLRRSAFAFWRRPSSRRIVGRRILRTFAPFSARVVSVTWAARSSARWEEGRSATGVRCFVRVANNHSHNVALPWWSAADINNCEPNDFMFVEVYHQNVSKNQLMTIYTIPTQRMSRVID